MNVCMYISISIYLCMYVCMYEVIAFQCHEVSIGRTTLGNIHCDPTCDPIVM